MTPLQNDFDRERFPVRRLAWYKNVKRREIKGDIKTPFTVTVVVQRKLSDSEGVWWEALIDFSDTYTVKKGSFLKQFVQHHH